MTKVKENAEKLKSLLEEENKIYNKIVKNKKEIRKEYYDYLSEYLKEKFNTDFYIYKKDYGYYHLDKLESLGYSTKTNGDFTYIAFFNVIDGININPSIILTEGLKVSGEIDFDIDDGNTLEELNNGIISFDDINIKNMIIISKKEYEQKYKESEMMLSKSTTLDKIGNTLNVGDKIIHYNNGELEIYAIDFITNDGFIYIKKGKSLLAFKGEYAIKYERKDMD